MAAFSNKSGGRAVVRMNADGKMERVYEGNPSLKCSTKKVREDISLDLDGEHGTGGRPRVKEEVKIPPNYEQVNLIDPDEPILFQGELVKYKADYNPTFYTRWVVVTENALRLYKSRCNSITCVTKPLFAIPVKAILKVEHVDFDVHMSKKEKAKFEECLPNQFEIYVKEDFIDFYMSADYDQKTVGAGHSSLSRSSVDQQSSPGRSSPRKSHMEEPE